MTSSDTIAKIGAALAKAQGEMTPAQKDSKNPHFNASYASLAAIWDACRAPLAHHALAVLQPVRADGARVTVLTLLVHDSGEWVSEELTLTAQAPTAQSVGSAITYGRRYGLAAMIGIAPDDDDDGNGATPDPGSPSQASPPPRPVRAETTGPEPATGATVGSKDPVISEAQARRFHTIATKAGWSPAALKGWLEDVWMLTSSRDIPRKKYDAICEQVERGAPPVDPDAPF